MPATRTPLGGAAGGRTGRHTLLRRSFTLIALEEGRSLLARNYLLGTALAVGGGALHVLGDLAGWVDPGEVARRLRSAGDAAPRRTLGNLVGSGLLVPRGSLLDRQERAWRKAWPWGGVAAAFHRELRDVQFASPEVAGAHLTELARRSPSPRVIPPRAGARLALPAPRIRRGVLPGLLRRHSVRELSRRPIGTDQLADLLFAGLGVRALVHDPVQGTLPLKLAPSGGARNPVDGYLYACRVRGVPAGVYRYSGLWRELERVRPGPLPAPRHLLGGQDWTDGAAAVIFLVASFHRTAWKYRHPIAYRAVLLEAGHIAQNLLVAAADLGLGATPTCAIADGVAEALLRISGPDRAVLHAVVVGRPKAPQRPRRSSRARSSESPG